jgi:hypothetical protein
VLTVLALCGISALVWIGSGALALLVITLDSSAIAGASASQSSPALFNLIIFGWVGPALVLLVGLLSAQAIGQRKAKMATAGVLLAHLLITALILAVAT